MKSTHSLSESILYPIHEAVCDCKDLETAKGMILKQLESAKVTKGRASQDLQRMYATVRSFTDMKRLHFWFYNNILAYCNNKVVQPIPTEKACKDENTEPS